MVEHSRGNITVYPTERYVEDFVITSPYTVMEIEGVVDNITIFTME